LTFKPNLNLLKLVIGLLSKFSRKMDVRFVFFSLKLVKKVTFYTKSKFESIFSALSPKILNN